MEDILTQWYTITSSDYEVDGKLEVALLLHYLQEAAGKHADKLGVGVQAMLSFGNTWYVTDYHLRIFRPFEFGEELLVRTWPSGQRRLYCLRDFEVVGVTGDLLGVASSAWIVVDIASRRPLRPEKTLPQFPLREYRCLDSSFPSIPHPESVILERTFRPIAADIDLNQHVNNAVYVRWALQTLPGDQCPTVFPEDIQVSFTGEALIKDEVKVKCGLRQGRGGIELLHLLQEAGEGRELARMRSVWKNQI